jgi:hypothetical protein
MMSFDQFEFEMIPFSFFEKNDGGRSPAQCPGTELVHTGLPVTQNGGKRGRFKANTGGCSPNYFTHQASS